MLRMVLDRILVEVPPISEKIGSIIAVRSKHEKLREGTVVAIGPGKRIKGHVRPLDVQVGDSIVFDKGTGMHVYHEGMHYLVMTEDDITVVTEQIQGETYDSSAYYFQEAVKF